MTQKHDNLPHENELQQEHAEETRGTAQQEHAEPARSDASSGNTPGQDEHSPQFYYEQAEKHKETAKDEWKTFMRTGVFVLAALVAILAAGLAWFVSNRSVDALGGAIGAQSRSVELRTKGSEQTGIHDDVLKNIMTASETDGEKSFWYKAATALGLLDTAPDAYAVNWLLKDESHAGNHGPVPDGYASWEAYWQNPPEGVERQNEAIEPGSHGTLTFYVVPKYDGDVKLTMHLDLLPYKAAKTGFNLITDDTTDGKLAKDFIAGHMLFFLKQTQADPSGQGAATTSLDWIREGSFSIEIEDSVKDQEYEYSLYWCWPQTFAEITMPVGDHYLNGRNPIFSEFANGAALREMIVLSDTLSMKNTPGRYFFSNLTGTALPTSQPEIVLMGSIFNESMSSSSADQSLREAFVNLSSYYNQGDQYIGGHVDCVRIRLTAEG